MNIDYKLIGQRIKRERKVRGITQEVLAERLNVSIGYVSQVGAASRGSALICSARSRGSSGVMWHL